MKKVNITFQDYSYECGDKCCTDYGTITIVNGKELEIKNDLGTTPSIVIEEILKELGYEVNVEYLEDLE